VTGKRQGVQIDRDTAGVNSRFGLGAGQARETEAERVGQLVEAMMPQSLQGSGRMRTAENAHAQWHARARMNTPKAHGSLSLSRLYLLCTELQNYSKPVRWTTQRGYDTWKG